MRKAYYPKGYLFTHFRQILPAAVCDGGRRADTLRSAAHFSCRGNSASPQPDSACALSFKFNRMLFPPPSFIKLRLRFHFAFYVFPKKIILLY